MIIADNIRITDPVIADALDKYDPEPIAVIIEKCVSAGAEAVDINSGPLNREPERKMAFLVQTVQSVTNLPLLIDTANPVAMEAGLHAAGNKAIINAFTLEPAKIEKILPLAKKYNTDIIGYLLYPDGHVPPDSTERLSIAIDLLEATQKAGIDENRLIIDPIIVPVSWQDGNFQAMEVLTVIRELPNVLGFPVRTVAALSNLTSVHGPARQKRILEKSYLPMLIAAGISWVMLNVLHREIMEIAAMSRRLSSPGIFCWESFKS